MKSINATLYEAFLKKKGENELYEKTKKFSLSDIKTFATLHDRLGDDDTLKNINLIRWTEEEEPFTSYNDIHDDYLEKLHKISMIKGVVNGYEGDILRVICQEISYYHEKRKQE
ncbi:MAG: hypothetical protein MPJ25_14980 [Pirellulales bacterium]|nr:hypothetical protein [Pirellulales bacterium]